MAIPTHDRKVHVDEYKYHLYQSLCSLKPGENPSYEGPALCGFRCGNRHETGCLTQREDVRIHSCEQGTGCPALSSSKTVFITPIISRYPKGAIFPEPGASGGGGDLTQVNDLELENEESIMNYVDIFNAATPDHRGRLSVLAIAGEDSLPKDKTVPINKSHLGNLEQHFPLQNLASSFVRLTKSEISTCAGMVRKPLEHDLILANHTADFEAANELPRRVVSASDRLVPLG